MRSFHIPTSNSKILHLLPSQRAEKVDILIGVIQLLVQRCHFRLQLSYEFKLGIFVLYRLICNIGRLSGIGQSADIFFKILIRR